MAHRLLAENIEMLVVHCSDTADDTPLSAADIHDMHLGFGWDGIGYHQVIARDGSIEAGRPEYWQGAHVYGVNDRSLGVCLIGRTDFTDAQFASLKQTLSRWKSLHPNARVVGHRDATDTHKTCPNFDAAAWWQSVGGDAPIWTLRHPVTALYAGPDQTSNRETELLCGEQVERHRNQGAFCEVTLATDGYRGWVATDAITPITPITGQPNAMIMVPSVVVTTAPKVTASSVTTLSMGSHITAASPVDGWIEVTLASGQTGYIPAHAIAGFGAPDSDPAAFAQGFIGTPYQWGGRSANGMDCSALIQLSYAACGVACPRNSGDQQAWFTAQPDVTHPALDRLQRGDLLFWPGHVAIMLSADALLHANAFHHAVQDEPVKPALSRLQQATGQTAIAIRPAPISAVL